MTVVVVGAAVAAIAAAAVSIVVAEVVPEIRAVVTLRAAVILQGAVLPAAVIRLDRRNMQAVPLNLIIHQLLLQAILLALLTSLFLSPTMILVMVHHIR